MRQSSRQFNRESGSTFSTGRLAKRLFAFPALAAPVLALASLCAFARVFCAENNAWAADHDTVPPGPELELSIEPPDEGGRDTEPACSFHHPLCVYGAHASPPDVVLAALAAADRAWDTLTGALEVPPPDGDLDGIWRVYLVPRIDGDGAALPVTRDPRARFDRTASYGVVQRSTPVGCALDLALARAIASGARWRVAPSTDAGSARAETETLARLASACSPGNADESTFQDAPTRPIVDPSRASSARGAAMFFEWLDAKAAEPGALVLGLWALAPTTTPTGATAWLGTPTGFDVLRASLTSETRSAPSGLAPASIQTAALDDLVVRFALQRALARNAKPRLAWRIPWPENARRLAAPEPPGPTGASYVLVDGPAHSTKHGAQPAPGRAKLRVEAEWEDYGRMRWVVAKLDAAGLPIAEIPIASIEHATNGSMTIESLEDTDRILIVGVNVGSTEHAFDPNQRDWEPHGWLLTLEAE